MDVYDLFSKFELETIPKDWVHSLWKDDFSEAIDFPTEYEIFLENTDIGELMSTACRFIKDWLESPSVNGTFVAENRGSNRSRNSSSFNESQVDPKSWQSLISSNVQHKALIAVISIFILRGKTEKQLEVKRLGLIATDFYLMLLAIPGSQVYHIFNPILYSHAVESLKICSMLSNSSPNSKPAAKKKRGRQDDDDFEDEEENDSEGEDFLPSDKNVIIKMLDRVLDNLLFTLRRFQLRGQDDSLLLTIQILILITRLERNSTSLFLKSPSHHTVSYLAYKAYKVLLALCSVDHGEVEETVQFIMREMMSGFLIFDQKGLKLTAKEALVIKDHSVQFVRHLLRNLKETAYLGVYTLIQHICVRIPDKADLRVKGVQVVQELLDCLPYSIYAHTVIWLMGLCHNDQVKNRITGLEIVTKLLHECERTPTSPLKPFPNNKKKSRQAVNGDAHGDGEHEVSIRSICEMEVEDSDGSIILSQIPDFSTHTFLLATIFSRCKDAASSVRAKALSILANLISSNNKNVKHEMELIFVTPYLNTDDIENSHIYEKGFLDFQHFLRNIKRESNPNMDPLPGGKAVITLLELFIGDEKVFVRKFALQVLSNIFLMNEKWMSNKLLQIMVDNCRDMSVSVRKLLVQCLTDLLLNYPTHPELPKYWVDGVLPLLADQEIKSQEKVLEALQTVLLDNLVVYDKMKTAHHALPWTLLAIIANQNKRQLFLYACHKWTLTNSLKQSLITVLRSHIGTENNDAAWFLLASFSEYLDIKDPQFVLDYFYQNVLDTYMVDEYCCQLVTEVVHLSWRQLPTISQVNLCDRLLQQLAQCTIPLPMISRCVDICQLITESHADSPEQARERVKEWAGNIISICETKLEKMIGPNSSLEVKDEERLSQYIFTVGELSFICPAYLKESSILLIENLLYTPENDSNTEQNTSGTSERWKGCVSASVQAVAVVTLGKLCLQKEQMAKAMVPIFARLLDQKTKPEIKINAMIVLTDMCVKFTSAVEHHVPEMCLCLRDKDLEVRKNTLTLLIQLIQEDYLKLRCPMYFHLLTMLNDESQWIRDNISSFIVNSLLIKQKNILVQHFVEALFHYNDCEKGDATYSKTRKMTDAERIAFLLTGPDKQEQRRLIYRFMLENMMDDHRFRVTYRLCTEILALLANGELKLNDNSTTLLQDALYCLSSEEIKLSQLRASTQDEDEGGSGEAQVAEAISNLARKTLVSQVVKKNMIENVVPIIIKLKRKLKEMKSPLVRDLLVCLRELMKDYKTEINEILAADKELAMEISHDLEQNAEEEEEEDEARVALASEEALQKAVMEVVALSTVRKSMGSATPEVRLQRLNLSQFQTTPNKFNCTPMGNGTPGKRGCVAISGSSPSAKRTSPAIKSSNLIVRSSPAKSSPGKEEINGEPKMPSPGGVSEKNKPSSPSGSSEKLENSQSEHPQGRKSVSRRRSRNSISSTSSEASTQSYASSSSRRGRRKR